MAIHNASDLLVYAKTDEAERQVTRIFVKTNNPLQLEDGQTTGKLTVSNITDTSGQVFDDIETTVAANNATSVLSKIAEVLTSASGNKGYSSTTQDTSGDYEYRDFTNGGTGIVPTLQISNGTTSPIATISEDSVIIEIITPGSSAIFDPVAFSTSASFSVNRDLIDITNKDSGGWSESQPGLKSFEISTESLQSINPDTPLDGSDFFDKLKNGTEVNLAYSDRIKNIIGTNLVQGGVDDFNAVIDQTNLQLDPFDGSTASKLVVNSNAGFNNLNYMLSSRRLEGKNVTWSFYVKADTISDITFYLSKVGGSQSGNRVVPDKVEILEGTQTSSNIIETSFARTVTGLNSTYTRVSVTYNNISLTNTIGAKFAVYPGTFFQVFNGQTVGDSLIVSSWQIEFSDQATDYQDPTDVTRWQGNALVSSLSFDAGVEDNLTCSATFTGKSNLYPNGLGPELIGDTQFDLGTVPQAGAYWKRSSTSIIQNGYGKIIATNQDTSIFKDGILTSGDTYLLTYTVHDNGSNSGNIAIDDAYSTSGFLTLPKTPGQTHKVVFVAADPDLVITNASDTGPTNIWLSSISLKQVL